MVSLLWLNGNRNRYLDTQNEEIESIMEDSFFNDMRIRRVFETIFSSNEDVEALIDVMSLVPSLDTVKYRQSFFEDILNDENESKIYYKVNEVVSRYLAYKEAKEKVKKRLLLILYNYNLFNVLQNIKDSMSSYLSTCSKEIIKQINLYLQSNQKLISKTQDLYNRIIELFKFDSVYHEGAPYVQIDTNYHSDNLEDSLKEIAIELDCKLEKVSNSYSKKEINPYFLFEILNKNDSLKNEIISYFEENFEKVISLHVPLKEYRFYILMKEVFNRIGSLSCYSKVTFDTFTKFTKCYDITLLSSNIKAVPNDFEISNDENMHFILGVNSGGKTCYLRSVAINYLFSVIIGYAFSESAAILPMKYIFSHFPNEEKYAIGEGRLYDEVKRLNKIKENFCTNSITFLNESFSSTSEDKACVLTYELIEEASMKNAKFLFVTHQYKIFEDIQDKHICFFTPVVDEENNNTRTYRINRVEKKLLSYVDDILIKHGLTKELLLKRNKK